MKRIQWNVLLFLLHNKFSADYAAACNCYAWKFADQLWTSLDRAGIVRHTRCSLEHANHCWHAATHSGSFNLQETWLVLVVQHLSFSQLPTWQSHMRDSRNSGRTWLLSREIPRTATLNETTRDFVLSAGANVHACLCSSLYKKAMAVISAPHMPWGLSWRSKCIKSDHSCIKKCVKSTNLEHQHLRATNTLRNWFDSINTVVRRRLHRKYKKIKTGSRFYMNEQ